MKQSNSPLVDAVATSPGGSKADRILDAALVLFDTSGYGTVPMPEIAREAGVAVGSIYRYFPSKEALANALYRREKQRLAHAVFDGVDLDDEPFVVFAAVWQRLGGAAERSPAALCFLELHHHAAYLDADSIALAASIDLTLTDLFERWQRAGAVRAGDPVLMLAQVFGGFVGVLRVCRGTGRTIDASLASATLLPAWASMLAVPSPNHMNEQESTNHV